MGEASPFCFLLLLQDLGYRFGCLFHFAFHRFCHGVKGFVLGWLHAFGRPGPSASVSTKLGSQGERKGGMDWTIYFLWECQCQSTCLSHTPEAACWFVLVNNLLLIRDEILTPSERLLIIWNADEMMEYWLPIIFAIDRRHMST